MSTIVAGVSPEGIRTVRCGWCGRAVGRSGQLGSSSILSSAYSLERGFEIWVDLAAEQLINLH
jgi:hypothetical protein